jgi:hypothetical protein
MKAIVGIAENNYTSFFVHRKWLPSNQFGKWEIK